MKMGRSMKWGAGLLALWLVAGCTQKERASEAPVDHRTAEPTQVSAPFDAKAVMRQVQHSFRSRGPGWEGGHDTYGVEVRTEGFSVRPRPSREASVRPVRFGPARVVRGQQVLSTPAVTGRVDNQGQLTLEHGRVTEHFRNQDSGVEHGWSFSQRPEGTGDLEVRVPLKSARFLGATATGLHFSADASGTGTVHGHGTWVDARGRRTPVPARFESGGIVLRVPAQVVEDSAWPAALTPIISPEFGVDLPVTTQPPRAQKMPAVARGTTSFLVVWQDARFDNSISEDIFGTLVDASGQVLHPRAIAISTATDAQTEPAVAFDGTNFLVIWKDRHGSDFTQNIHGARVDGSGRVLDPTGVALSRGTQQKAAPALAFDGTNFLVTWQERQSNRWGIRATRVSRSAEVLDPAGIALASSNWDQTAPAVASTGGRFLVVWEENQNIHGGWVSATGTALNPMGFVISDAAGLQRTPTVAHAGTTSFVVWEDHRGATTDIQGARVEDTGVVHEPQGLAVSTAAGEQLAPSVDFDGTDFFVAWKDFRDTTPRLFGARVGLTGLVRDPAGLALCPLRDQNDLRLGLAFDGTNHFLVWTDDSPSDARIQGTRLDRSGNVLDAPRVLSLGANAQIEPAVAFDGTNFLVVWSDARQPLNDSSSTNIHGARVSPTGVLLDPDSIAISTGGGHRQPAVAFNGTHFLVVWTMHWRIMAARVSKEGVVLDKPGITLQSSRYNHQYAQYPAVASNGQDFFVTWTNNEDPDRAVLNRYLLGKRVSAAGEVLEYAPLQLSPHVEDVPRSMAFDGTNYFLVWKDSIYGTPYGARVNSEGRQLNTWALAQQGYFVDTQVASNGNGALVVWSEYVSGKWRIIGNRVAPTGIFLDPNGILISEGNKRREEAVAVYDGSHYVVVWKEFQGDVPQFQGVRVSATGEVRNDSAFALTDLPTPAGFHKLASVGGWRTLLVYNRAHLSPETNIQRVVARFLDLGNAVPVATPQEVTLDEDVPGVITLSGTDANGDPLTYAVGRPPAHGRLTGNAPQFTYTPDLDFHGTDSFTFTAADLEGATSAPATVRITVRPINDIPVALAQSVALDEDTSAGMTLSGSDVDGDALTFTVGQPPAHGRLTGSAPRLTYQASADYHGQDSFTFTVTDSAGATSAPATVGITVRPVNDAPVATAQTVATNEDEPLSLTLSGTDVEGEALTYTLSGRPTNGTLSGTAPHLVYQPRANFHGQDAFSFFVTDASGATSLAPAQVSITVRSVPDAPVAYPMTAEVNEDSAITLLLRASDAEQEALTYTVVRAPVHGSLSGSVHARTYRPHPDYHGQDSFTFIATDTSGLSSSEATVSLVVRPVNDAPVSFADTVELDEDGSVALTLRGSDVDGDALTYTVSQKPVHGVLSGSAPHLTYQPEADYHGPDFLTFLVRDTVGATSATSRVSFTVNSINDAPVAHSQVLSTGQEPTSIRLSATDVEGDVLSWHIQNPPSQGRLTGEPPSVVYTPPPDFRGTTDFTFTVSDGQATSAPVTVSLEVKNGAPQLTLSASALRMLEGTPVSFTAVAKDPGGDTLTYDWRFGDGTRSEEPAPTHTYAQDGLYEVVLSVSDGVESVSATLSLQVVNGPPRLAPLELPSSLLEGTPATFQAIATDVDPLTYTWDFGDGTPLAQGPQVTHTYADDGAYKVSVTVRDDAEASARLSREVVVSNVAPVPESLPPEELRAGETLRVTFQARDPAGEKDPLTWTILEGPGTLTPEGHYTWTPSPDAEGDFLVRAQVSDGDGDQAECLLSIKVSRVAGCGCTNTGEAFSLTSLLLLVWASRSRRRA